MYPNNTPTNNQLDKLDKKIEHFEDKIEDGLISVKNDVKDIKSDVKEIKHEVKDIERAEKTLFKLFSGVHKKLLNISQPYYKWHMWPYSRKIHWATLFVYIIVIIALVLINLYFQPKNLTHAAAGINKMISYQGKLTDENDIPVPDGSYNLKISVYDALTDGSCLWTWKGACGAVTAVPVTVTDGIFNVMLGDSSYQTTNTLTLDFNADTYYMGVTVGADAEMTPRKRIGAAGYAYNSDTIDGIHASSTATASYLLPLDGNVDFALPDDSKVVFRDAGLYIQSATDGKLTISSDGSGADDIILSGTVTANATLTVTTSQTITGIADGTDALTLTAGDILVSDGDVDISGGDFNVTLDAGDVVAITNSASTSSGSNALHVSNTTAATNVGTVASATILTTLANYDDDGDADSRTALNINVTNNATDAGTDDNITGIVVQDLSGSNNADGNEYAIYQAGTTWDYGLYITDAAYFGSTISILESTGATYTTTIQGGNQSANLTYTLPTAYPAVTGYVLSATDAGVMSWIAAGGSGDISAVGSMTSGDAFADATADNDWLGLGSGAGRIEFDDQATDEVNILQANVGIGTATPNELLTVEGTLSLVEQTSSDTATSGYGKIFAKKPSDSSGIDEYTKLILHYDGADGSTTFTDNSNSSHSITAYDNAQIDTAQSKFGGASYLGDGAGDYLTAGASSDWNFSSSDYTVEAWVRVSAVNLVNPIVHVNSDTTYFGLYASHTLVDNKVLFTNQALGISGLISSAPLSTDTWHHIAATVSGNSAKLFVDGVLEDSDEAFAKADYSASGIKIGVDAWSNEFSGWMDELRISKGIARWTLGFTPPSSPYSNDIYDLYYVDSQGDESVLSAWEQNATGDEIAYADGNVGIGVLDPTAKLEVQIGSTDAVTGLLVDQDDLDQIGLQITQAADATANALDISSYQISGNIIDLSYAGAETQTGAIAGISVDFTNLTASGSHALYGITVNDQVGATGSTEYGLYIQGTNWDYGLYNSDDTYSGGNQIMADNMIIGFGTGTPSGRIEFDDQTPDEVNFLDVNVGINTSTPGSKLDILFNSTGITTDASKALNLATTGATFNTTSGNLSNYGAYFTNTSTESAGANTLTNIALYLAASGADANYALITNGGNVGIGTTAPTALLSVAEKFLVDSNGNITKINNVAYSWPASQGAAGTVLTNNGSGTLAWSSPSKSGKGQFSGLTTKNFQTDSYTKLLVQANGTDAATTFYDSSLLNKAITATGNAQIDTAQSKFGGSSALFDASGDYLAVPDSDDWAWGTGDFTVDFWVRFNALPGNNTSQNMFTHATGSGDFMRLNLLNNAGVYQWYFDIYSSSVQYVLVQKNAAATSTGTWYHIALVRNGNNWMVFQDGTQCGTTVVDADSVPNYSGGFGISYSNSGFFASTDLNGWLDEFRVSKGIARWTTNFTAPTVKYNSSGDEIAVTANSIIVADDSNNLAELLDVNLTSIDIMASGANGLDTGSEAVGWYYVWAIYNGSTTAGLLSTSSTSPTMPEGYTYKALVGAVYNDNPNKNFLRYNQYANKTYYTSRVQVLNSGTSTSMTSVSLSSAVPPNATEAQMYGWASNSSSGGYHIPYISADGTNIYTQLIAYASTDGPVQDTQYFSIPMLVPQTTYYYIGAVNGLFSLWVNGFILNL